MGNSGSKETVQPTTPTPVVVPGKTVDYSKMPTLRFGDTGENVAVLQARLKELGFFKGQVLGNFLEITRQGVKGFQSASGLGTDGVVGKQTWAALAKGKDVPTTPPTHIEDGDAPWVDFILKYLGKKETDKTFGQWLSGFWRKYTGLNYNSIVGADNAWCALFMNTALEETGFKGTGSAAAASFRQMGDECDYVYGALIPLRHKAGNNHITVFISWTDKSKKLAKCLGGNQNNEVRYTVYDLSGNANGGDEVLYGPRWPRPKAGTVIVKPNEPTAPVDTGTERIKGSWEEGHTERASWSDKIVELFRSNFALFAGARDMTEICPKFNSLTDRLKLKVLLEFWIAVAYYESGYNPKSSSVDVGSSNDRNSYSDGLYQMSGNDSSAKKFGYDYKKLLEPIPNIEVALEQLRKQVVKEGLMFIPNTSSMRYWAVILKGNRYNKIPQIIDRVKRNAPEAY